jgi:hypothetical protein
MRKFLFGLAALVLAGCSGGLSIPQVIGNLITGGNTSGIATPSPGQWVCYHCSGMSLGGNGSFTFPNSSGAVGYIYTGASGNPSGKTITLTYTVSGAGAVLPSPASGSGDAQVRLFLWRKGDDMACSVGNTEFYRWWATTAGPLTPGQHIVSAVVTSTQWTDCFAKQDAGQLANTAANLVGIGFTFGAEFFGHGVYSTGSNTFTVNSFTVQ